MAGLAVGIACVGLLAWPRGTARPAGEKRAVASPAASNGQTPKGSGNAEIAGTLTFTEHFCPLAAGKGGVQVRANGWTHYRDPHRCFVISYPATWHLEENESAVHLWADTPKDGTSYRYWDADVVITKPSGTFADEESEYEAFAKKYGVAPGAEVLRGAWEETVNGDGSSSSLMVRETRVFTGRGEFVVGLAVKKGNLSRQTLLEKVAETFQAQ